MSSTAADKTPLKVFVSYSHRDEPYKDDLVVFLKALKNLGKIRIWQDRAIDAGSEWNQEILQALDSADIILLLVTARFIGSDFCFSKEMTRALMHHEQKTARVVPIIISPCAWQQMPFAKLQVLPTDGKPVTEWSSHDAGYDNVIQGIARVVDKMQEPATPVDDGWSTPPTAKTTEDEWSTPVATNPESSQSPPANASIGSPEPKSKTQKRLDLFQLLSNLPGPTFESIVYALNVPPPLMPPPVAPQGQRVPALLNWAQSPVGCGLDELETVVSNMMQS
ncbi:MAG: toll/interleukin-1 receptor domain-containing protein [Cyanobacteria bacterium P01_H01_bin.58]